MYPKNKKIIILTIALLSVMLFCGAAIASPSVMLDGQQLSFTDAEPTIEDGRTLVPLRAIFEAMGATVTWDAESRTALAQKGNTTVVLPIGSTEPIINGTAKVLDVPAKIVDGRTLAPLRFVGEAFGGNVRWEGSTQTIYITSSEVQLSSTEKIFVHYIDVGQADSIYIDLPNNNDILIDAGNRADGSLVVNYLKKQDVDDIELLIATHPHEDHIGGLPDVFDAFVVEQTIDSGHLTDSQISGTFKDKATDEGNYTADNYQQFTYGDIILDILTGNQEWDDCNNYSVVCRLDTGDIEFLFTGDAEAPVENILTGKLDAEILKVGHHGSSSSSSPAFLNKVNPEVAIICCGTGNSYGHPHQETLNKLQNIGAEIYRTDLNGNIVVSTDGSTYSVSTQKEAVSPIIRPAGTPPALPVSSQGEYVGSKKSNKYHKPDCRYAEKIEWANQIWFSSKEEAEAAGYEACKVCKPRQIKL